MSTTLLFLQKKSLVLFALLLSSAGVFAQTISSVSPTRASYKATITINGTGFTSSHNVTVGGVAVASKTFISATQISVVLSTTTPAGSQPIQVGTVSMPNALTYVAPTLTPSSASVSRLISDFGGYWSSTATTTIAAQQPDTHHDMLAFEFANISGGGKTIYSTGVDDAKLTPARVSSFSAGDFRALPIDIIGSTSGGTDNFLIYGNKIDGNATAADYRAVANVHVRDVLMDGKKGLDLGTGVTNINPSAIFEFDIARIAYDKLDDDEPDLIITQVADPSTTGTDVYYFTDASGNIVGKSLNAILNNITAIGTYKIDLFTLAPNTPYATVTPSGNGSASGGDTRDLRLIGLRLSDFGINTSNYSTITKFKIFPGGTSDAAFTAYNANSIFIPPPVITSQPASFAGCPTTSPNGNATFTVTATGGGKYYQWKKNGVDIPGATNASYTIIGVTDAHVGAYTVEVRNVAGTVLSDPSYLGNYWTGAIDNDWNNPGNWNCGLIPSTTLSANIPNVPGASPRYPIIGNGSTGTCLDLNISSAAKVEITGTGALQIAGTIHKSGALNAVDGTVRMIGTTGAQAIPANTFATNYIKNLTINNTNGVILAGELNLTGILAPTAGTFTTGNLLTLKSNENTTAMIAPVTGSISGQMTVERYIPSKRAFRFLSSSVDATATVNPARAATINANWQENKVDLPGWGTDITGAGAPNNGFDTSGSNNPSLYTYLNNNTGTGNSWIAATSTDVPLVAGVPYRILVRGDRTINQHLNASPSTVTTLRVYGNARTGNVTYTDLTTNPSRYVFVGNPYQAPIDIKSVLAASTGFSSNFYNMWDPTINTRGAYVTVDISGEVSLNNVSGSVADRYAQPGQAFFIQTAAATQTLNFTEAQKHVQTSTAHVFRNASQTATAQMRFTLYENSALTESGTSADGFVVRFSDEYSNEVDGFDAVKIGNQDENTGILNSGKTLSFENRNLPTVTDVINLTNNQYRATNYTYKVELNGLENVTAFLLDKFTNSKTELVNGSVTSIPFTVNAANASAAADRFDIVFEALALGNEESAFSNALKVYPNPVTNNQFFIESPSGIEGNLKVKVVNLLGQEVFSQSFEASEGAVKMQPKTQLQSGVYLVNISNGTNTATKKLIVK